MIKEAAIIQLQPYYIGRPQTSLVSTANTNVYRHTIMLYICPKFSIFFKKLYTDQQTGAKNETEK